MVVRTFYWKDRVVSSTAMMYRKIARKNSHLYFTKGNAGDIFSENLIQHYYQKKSLNLRHEGKRLLCVGSIAQLLKDGDIVCGVGCKTEELPKNSISNYKIYGLRGPITYELFKKNNYDLSNVKFLYDPGLLIRYFIDEKTIKKNGQDIIFIPHYRERNLYKKIKGIKIIDVDKSPLDLAKDICSAKFVFSSSLHGLIFSHALNRPCSFIKPRTDEPLLKYEDYYLSIGLKYKKPIEDIENISYINLPNSPCHVEYTMEDFVFPSIDELIDHGIAF